MASSINASTSSGLVNTADTSGVLALQTANTTAVTIDASQNVGIGTTSPSRKLTVYATGNSVPAVITNDQTQSRICFKDSVTALDYTVGIGSIGENLASYTGGTERMRITSAGNVGIGTSSPNYPLQIANANASLNLYVQNTAASGSGDIVQVAVSLNTTNGTNRPYAYYNTGAGAYRFWVLDSGNVQNTNNSYGAFSDAKLKENITDATPKLEDLCKVKIRNYNLKSDQTHKQIGVVAQELEEVFPSVVEEFVDRDEKGSDLGTTTKTVKYSVFVPMLIKAIQEQQALIANLTTRLSALEGAK
jgi:hypothetical protein